MLPVLMINAQDGEDVGWVARFGIAGGVNPVYFFPNIDAVNNQANNMGLGELSKSGMFLWGGSGYAYIMFISNLRLGGIGLSGTISSKGTYLNMDRELDYSFGLGGVTIEYTLPFIQKVAVSVGTIVGVGTQSIEAYQNEGKYNWENSFPQTLFSSLATPGNYSKLKNTFFTFTPTLNLDFPLSRFMAFRVGGGYIMNFNDKWKVNNGQEISGVPGNLTNNNFFIQTGIYFGFIAY